MSSEDFTGVKGLAGFNKRAGGLFNRVIRKGFSEESYLKKT